MNLHQRIINEIKSNPEMLNATLGLISSEIGSDVSMSTYGDMDLVVNGIDYFENPLNAVIEVKSHRGLVPHYVKCQLPKYKLQVPDAKQLVVYSKTGFESFLDLEFEEY